jgi:hypothetical protein
MPTTTALAPVVLRPATAADARALAVLAALDSAEHLPPAPLDVAEVGGELRAAVSRADGSAVADPFHPTAALVSVLREHHRLATRPSWVAHRRSRGGTLPEWATA